MTPRAFLVPRQNFRLEFVVRDCFGASAEFVFVSDGFGDVRKVGAPEFRDLMEAPNVCARMSFAVPILCVSGVV